MYTVYCIVWNSQTAYPRIDQLSVKWRAVTSYKTNNIFFLSNKSWPENVKWVVPILILFGCNLVGPRKTKATCYYFPKLGQVDPPYSVLYIQSLQFCKDQATVQPFNILKSVPLNFSISLSRFIKGGMNIIDLLGILPYFMSLSLNLVTTRTR